MVDGEPLTKKEKKGSDLEGLVRSGMYDRALVLWGPFGKEERSTVGAYSLKRREV